MNETEFRSNYIDAPDARRMIEAGDVSYDNGPWVHVEHKGRSLYLEVREITGETPADDHLCIDVHAFVDGQDATTAAFGMGEGVRTVLPKTGTTSHGWPSANMIVLMVGTQGTDEDGR